MENRQCLRIEIQSYWYRYEEKPMTTTQPTFNSLLDLKLERIIDVPPSSVWRAYTEPELLKKWFCPTPWKTIDAELDVRPGGIFRTTMQSPEGQEFPNLGCYLEAIKNERIVWTNAMLPGFRPAPVTAPCSDEAVEFMFTAFIEMMPHGEAQTRYRATVVHANEAGCKAHAAMGFEGGWGAALDQLVVMVKSGI
jgi:uncharacterized protein YndB with AHSA1/START domain